MPFIVFSFPTRSTGGFCACMASETYKEHLHLRRIIASAVLLGAAECVSQSPDFIVELEQRCPPRRCPTVCTISSHAPWFSSMWNSSPWELRPQGIQDNSWNHAVRFFPMAGVGPRRRRGDQAYQICVRTVHVHHI